jgi:hypothetical protein
VPCARSIRFITGVWWQVYSTPDLAAIVNWQQVVFGNAQVLGNGSIECQHGPVECQGNL